MSTIESFADPVIIIAEDDPVDLAEMLYPRQKVSLFVKGIVDNAIDLVTFRCNPELAEIVADQETEIWRALNALQMVASSIAAERSNPHHYPLLKRVQ